MPAFYRVSIWRGPPNGHRNLAFKSEGLIDMAGKGITLKNPEGLKGLS